MSDRNRTRSAFKSQPLPAGLRPEDLVSAHDLRQESRLYASGAGVARGADLASLQIDPGAGLDASGGGAHVMYDEYGGGGDYGGGDGGGGDYGGGDGGGDYGGGDGGGDYGGGDGGGGDYGGGGDGGGDYGGGDGGGGDYGGGGGGGGDYGGDGGGGDYGGGDGGGGGDYGADGAGDLGADDGGGADYGDGAGEMGGESDGAGDVGGEEGDVDFGADGDAEAGADEAGGADADAAGEADGTDLGADDYGADAAGDDYGAESEAGGDYAGGDAGDSGNAHGDAAGDAGAAAGGDTQTFDDGSTLTTNPDGTTSATDAPADPTPETQTFDDGSTLTTNPDGTTTATDAPSDAAAAPPAEDQMSWGNIRAMDNAMVDQLDAARASSEAGYYGSPLHQAYAALAVQEAAAHGINITPEQAMALSPWGGLTGNGAMSIDPTSNGVAGHLAGFSAAHDAYGTIAGVFGVGRGYDGFGSTTPHHGLMGAVGLGSTAHYGQEGLEALQDQGFLKATGNPGDEYVPAYWDGTRVVPGGFRSPR